MCDNNILPSNKDATPASGAHRLYTAGLYLFAFTCNFSISAAQISLGLALIGFILLYRAGKALPKSSPLDLPFAFFAFTGLLSVFRAENLSRAIPEMKTFLLIFCFYLAYWHDTSATQQRNMLKLFLASATLVSLISNFQSFFLELPRAKGFYSMPMTFGECQSLSLLVATLAFTTVKTTVMKIVLLFSGASIAYAVLFSMVRSAWIGLFFGFSIMIFHFPKRTLAMLFVVILAISPVIYMDTEIQDRFIGMDPLLIPEIAAGKSARLSTSNSLQASYYRLTIWWRGFQMIENNFAFGVGLKNVKTHYEKLATEKEFSEKLIWGHQHNNFMHILASLGFPGLIAFFNFFLATLFFIWPSRDKKNLQETRHARVGATAVFLCFLVFGFSEYSWGDEEVSMMALFLTGMMVNRHAGQSENQASEEVATLP